MIAAIHGYCIGIGVLVASAWDILIADARFVPAEADRVAASLRQRVYAVEPPGGTQAQVESVAAIVAAKSPRSSGRSRSR